MLQKYYNHEELSRKLNQIIVDNRQSSEGSRHPRLHSTQPMRS